MDNILQHHGILGQKWGVRRYQNKDGTLTDTGRKRYDRDVAENKAKKKDNRIDVSNPDPNRWVKEDLERSKRVIDSSNELIKKANEVKVESSKKKMDLSEMTDKELRDRINRELLERQYSNLFAEENASTVSKGHQVLSDILKTTGTVLSVGSSAIGLALSIKQLKG